MKCKYCGKEYKINENIPTFLPDYIKEKIKYIPACDCYEKKFQEEQRQKEIELEKERSLNKVKKYKDLSVISNKFLSSTFENANMKRDNNINICKRYADSFLKKNVDVGLILYGNSGTGKTFDSACIANYLMQQGKSVLALNLALYLTKLKSEWNEAEIDILDKVSKCDLLIIDDLGVEKESEWTLEKTFLLIDARYRSGKPLIISTNLNFSENNANCEILKKYGIRIKDRLNEMCFPILYKSNSIRKLTADRFAELIA